MPLHDTDRMPIPDFPRLSPENHRNTSPADRAYNCIAWAAGDTSDWWQPGFYWPVEADPDAGSVEDLIRAYESLGYVRSADADFTTGGEWIAVYGDEAHQYTHAARRLASGKWTSKIGKKEDIEHDTPDDVAGGVYGQVVAYLRRPAPPIS